MLATRCLIAPIRIRRTVHTEDHKTYIWRRHPIQGNSISVKNKNKRSNKHHHHQKKWDAYCTHLSPSCFYSCVKVHLQIGLIAHFHGCAGPP